MEAREEAAREVRRAITGKKLSSSPLGNDVTQEAGCSSEGRFC